MGYVSVMLEVPWHYHRIGQEVMDLQVLRVLSFLFL